MHSPVTLLYTDACTYKLKHNSEENFVQYKCKVHVIVHALYLYLFIHKLCIGRGYYFPAKLPSGNTTESL